MHENHIDQLFFSPSEVIINDPLRRVIGSVSLQDGIATT